MKEEVIQKFTSAGYASFPCGSARLRKSESNQTNLIQATIKKEVSSFQK